MSSGHGSSWGDCTDSPAGPTPGLPDRSLAHLPALPPPQEVVEMLTRNDGIVVMAPPSDNAEARKNIATLLSAIKPKQKVGRGGVGWAGGIGKRLMASVLPGLQPSGWADCWPAVRWLTSANPTVPSHTGGGGGELRRAGRAAGQPDQRVCGGGRGAAAGPAREGGAQRGGVPGGRACSAEGGQGGMARCVGSRLWVPLLGQTLAAGSSPLGRSSLCPALRRAAQQPPRLTPCPPCPAAV